MTQPKAPISLERHQAEFSPDRLYRYWLKAEVNHRGAGDCLFLMLNPSVADEVREDRTVKRCKIFVRDWNFANLVVCNLFAFRATDADDMKAAEDPVGPDNDDWIVETSDKADEIILAWGGDGTHLGRSAEVLALLGRRVGAPILDKVYHLGTTKAEGQPKHPLYQPAKTQRQAAAFLFGA